MTSIRGADPGQVLVRLGELCIELLPVAGASVSLMAETAARRLLYSSDDVATQLTEAQFTLGDGPCMRAFSTGAPVFATDLSKGEDARRWPVVALRALE